MTDLHILPSGYIVPRRNIVKEIFNESVHFVHDDFQGRGLTEFYGYIEPMNGRMTALYEKLGMTRSHASEDLVRVSLLLAR